MGLIDCVVVNYCERVSFLACLYLFVCIEFTYIYIYLRIYIYCIVLECVFVCCDALSDQLLTSKYIYNITLDADDYMILPQQSQIPVENTPMCGM